MEVNRKELKRAAREAVSMARPRPMVVTLVYGLLSLAVPLGLGVLLALGMLLGGRYRAGDGALVLGAFLYLLIILVSYLARKAFGFGYSVYALRLADGECAGYGELFAGFGSIGRVFLLALILAGFYLVWSWAVTMATVMLTALVGMALSYVSEALTSLAMLIGLLGGAAVLLLMLTRYAFAFLALADNPALGAREAVRLSRALVRGRSGEVFCFYISFAGWFLLAVGIYMAVAMGGMMLSMLAFGGSRLGALAGTCSILAGIAAAIPLLLWLVPYMSTAAALYYRALTGPEPL